MPLLHYEALKCTIKLIHSAIERIYDGYLMECSSKRMGGDKQK